MSFALENKHKQSRENIEKTNNNLGKAKKPWENQKKKNKRTQQTNKTILRDSWLDPPFPQDFPRSVLLVVSFFGLAFPRLLLVFSRFFVFLVFLFRSICVLIISKSKHNYKQRSRDTFMGCFFPNYFVQNYLNDCLLLPKQ